MDFRETAWEGVNWIHLVQDKEQWRIPMNTVMNPRLPQKAGNFLIR